MDSRFVGSGMTALDCVAGAGSSSSSLEELSLLLPSSRLSTATSDISEPAGRRGDETDRWERDGRLSGDETLFSPGKLGEDGCFESVLSVVTDG